MTSSTTGDRRWGTTRRSGMTILGKVAVPKPINLPSQRLENQGLEPNVEIVPKGTLSWGSKSSLNAWGTSSLSPRTESGPGSPSHLSNLPSSGGSVTRPSTADSDKAQEASSIPWDSNSRPSSASGVFPSNQASVALQRPHSADTRPGSSQLSRFAEAVSETSTWGQHVAAEKLGVAPTKNDGTSGDFPSLGAEKENSEKSTRPQDIGPHTRPASSSGRYVEERAVDCTEEANVQVSRGIVGSSCCFIMTSSTTGDRRWSTTRSGMTILGKVAVPKPINLPSQRLENQGLDPNVEIIPTGTLSWGSKSSLNAWGTSSLSPRTESGPGSSSHLRNRPSSGASVTRPSTADSDKAHETSSIAWDSNSRPSSASGVFPSNQASVALQRPHSADTRPGSSQLSRFAEAVSETSTWGQHVAAEKLGVAPTKNDGSSGDFSSFVAEKESSEKSTRPQDIGPHARPASSSGRYVEERGVDCTEEANVQVSRGIVGSSCCFIMTSSTTGDRRWGTTRSGMTILGKVAVPKPINLPSQRLENQGLDQNGEIVPKGTLSWGSKSSLNASGTSSLSPRTESGSGSPSHLSNLPSSGGSVTRPSTADSDKAHEASSIAWDSNSRPSSASGVFPSNQASVALQRPHSADTRPGSSQLSRFAEASGSSQLSRFAEAVSETSTWGQHVAAEKLGVAPTKNDGTSGDFPSLGAEKESSEKSARPQDIGPHARPAFSSGRYVEERGVDCTEEANVQVSRGIVGSSCCFIMTSSTTGDRRWGTTRRSGMTILGKVAVPKPINLPSQRLENQGLDQNGEIVPKGTLSWGSKSSLNASGTSSLSPRTESGPGSPSHLSNLPSSGGSVTRPSTADSDKAHEASSIAWDSNSRPSSASGVFPSNQASVALQRPHSADTRPGSSQLSRFAEAVSETSTWGQHVAAEKLGVAPTKNDGTSGDFPSLGAEKESSEKSTRPQDIGPHACPASSSGIYVEELGVDCTEETNVRIGDANSWRRDNQPYSEDVPRHCREKGQLDSHGSQSYPNANFPHQYDAWRCPPVNNHQGGGWYRGNHPYGAPMGPGGFHMDPFPFYPTQVPPVPGHEAGPRGNHTTNEKMFRPPMLDSYGHPRMQTRPGFYLGPVPYEGYYGRPMGYGSPSNRDLPFAGRPAGPHAYKKRSGQGGYDTPGSSVALEQNEPSHSQETQRQYKVLLNPQDGRFGEDEVKRIEFLGNRFPNAEKVGQQMQTSKNDRRENSNEASGEVQPIKAENAAPEDPSLIQKIEGLNAKTRTNDGWQNASSFVNRDEQESKTRIITENPVNKVSARVPRTGNASDSKNSSHYKQGDPATNKNTELAVISKTAISRRSTQQTQGRADLPTKQRVNSEGSDGWRKTTVMSGSSRATLAANSESFPEVNVGDTLGSIRKPGPEILADPNDNQRSTMKELARQRAQQRQKEEEERARDQRAKALAKLEELNRRSQVSEDGSVKNLEAASNASIPDMPEYPGSLSPALVLSNSDNVHVHSSLEMKPTVEAAKSVKPSGESGKPSLQDSMASTGYANNVGPTHQDNPPRDRDGNASKQKRLGYMQKQHIVFEKTMAGNFFSVATTEVFDVVPSPEVVNEGVLSHNSDMPATSSISTESTFTKRKKNRTGKKKHKIEETPQMNTTRVAVGKETKSGDESIETGRARTIEMELGSVSVPSLDIKVSGNSSEQISSFTNEETQIRAKNNWKSKNLSRTQRNSLVNKPADKFPGSNAVIWAPIHIPQKADVSIGVGTQNTAPKSVHQGQSSAEGKIVGIERYVAKPVVKEMAEQIVSKNLITAAAAPEMTENVLQKENCGSEGTGILQSSGSTAGKSGSPSKSRHGNSRQGKHGREHGSWHQRGAATSSKALEDGKFVTPNQPIRGTVNYHSSNQTEQFDVGSAKDQPTSNDDGWNDGWYMTPETPYSAAVEMEASAPQAGAVGKDQGVSMHGKQHASRSNTDDRSNYVDPKKANKREYNKAHMQHSDHGLSQPDLPVASKESRGPGDHVSRTAVAPNINRTGKYGGCESTRDKAYGSQRKDGTGYEHQGFTTEQTSAETQAQSQNRSTNKEVKVEQYPNSMFQKNAGQSRRFGRGQESQGGWGLSVQENMHHHHQRPHSNRDWQKQNRHYEYKPVGSRASEGEHNREQLKDSSQTEGPPYREKGQGQQRHGGQKLYQQQRGTAGRNTGHGLTGERN